MLTPSDLERERYEARLKMQRDIHTRLAETRDEAIAAGRQEGLAAGRKEGRVEQIHFCQRMLQQPLTPREELLALAADELDRLAGNLEAELAGLLRRPQ